MPLARLLKGRADTAGGHASRQAARRGSLAAHLIIPLVIGAGSLVFALALGAELLVQERAQQDLVARRADQATELTRRFVLDTERTLTSSARQLASLPGISESLPTADASRLRSELLSAQNRDPLGLVLVLNAGGEVATDLMGPGTLDLLKPLLPRVQTGGEQSALVWRDDDLWMLAAAPERTAAGSQPGLVIVGRQIDARSLPDRGAAGASVALAFAGRSVGPTELPDSVEGRNAIMTAGGDGLEAITSVPLEPYRESVRAGYIGIAATAIGCLILFIVYSGVIIRRAARPLKALAQAVSAVAAGDRTVAVPVEGPDEVATVGGAFNEMVAAIAAREDELRRLARDNEARFRELEVLNELSLTILSSPNLETIGSRLADQAMAVGSFDLANIYFYESDEDLVVPLVTRGMRHPERVGPRQRNLATTVAGGGPVVQHRFRLIASQQIQVIEDLQAEDGFRTLRAEGVESAVIVPLRAGTEILGLMQLGSRTPRRFQPNEIHLPKLSATRWESPFRRPGSTRRRSRPTPSSKQAKRRASA